MKRFIYNEMMVHIPLCTSKDPKNVLIISNNSTGLEDEIKKHTEIDFKTISCSIDSIREESDSIYDVVICEMDGDAAVIAHINRISKDDAQLVIKHDSLDETKTNKILMQVLSNYYKIIMPYNIGDNSTALLASKEYHPTADIILQRADMIDNLDYYNCDIHIASFAMPNYIRKEYLGIIKN